MDKPTVKTGASKGLNIYAISNRNVEIIINLISRAIALCQRQITAASSRTSKKKQRQIAYLQQLQKLRRAMMGE